MTTDKHAKRAARDLAAREGISYTTARRRLTTAAADAERQEPRPPAFVPTTSTPCPQGCEGSGHPGTACWAWRSADTSGGRWEVRRAAELPGGRAEQLAQRGEKKLRDRTPGGRRTSFHAWEDRWLLALVYAMLTNERPELLPDWSRLRAAVEADDLPTVDALMEPLDRAAARLMTKTPATWWGEVKPRLDAYADAVGSDDREPTTWQELEARHVVERLVDRWRKAWVPARDGSGYVDPFAVRWLSPKDWLDARLVDEHGGHAPRTRVRLDDGRPAVVYAVEWGEDGPPVAYRVRELVPGRHGNVGRLVPSLTSDLLVAAADCREDRPCAECGREAGPAASLCDGCAPRFVRCRCGAPSLAGAPCAICRTEESRASLDG